MYNVHGDSAFTLIYFLLSLQTCIEIERHVQGGFEIKSAIESKDHVHEARPTRCTKFRLYQIRSVLHFHLFITLHTSETKLNDS